MPIAAQKEQRKQAIRFKRILLATDFSDASQHAQTWALAVARRHSAELQVVHAFRPGARQPIPLDPLPRELDRRRIEAEQQLMKLAASLQVEHLPSHAFLRQGPVSAVVSSVIQNENADLLVLGTHGRKGLKKIALGSVAEELLRLVKCPVLTIGRNVPDAPATIDLRCILFATDFGPAAARALSYAVFLAEEHGAELILLHMVPPLPVLDIGPAAYLPADWTAQELTNWEARQQKESADKLRQLLPAEAKLARQPQYIIATNFLPEGILSVATKHGADLIVMGANPTDAVRTAAHVPWSVIHHVVSEARCPILTVTA